MSIDTLMADDEAEAVLRARFRDDLRAARHRVQADAEGFLVVVHAIERLGRAIHAGGPSLAGYEGHLVKLVARARGPVEGLSQRLFLLRQSRNDHAHQGFHARNAAREAVSIALILEDALSSDWNLVKVEHVMVRDPVTTRPGDKLADVRQRLLENAYTALPAWVDGKWFLLTDRWLAALLVVHPAGERRKLLDCAVEVAVAKHPPERAVLVPATTLVKQLAEYITSADGGTSLLPQLVLVGSPDKDRLEGVVAPADVV